VRRGTANARCRPSCAVQYRLVNLQRSSKLTLRPKHRRAGTRLCAPSRGKSKRAINTSQRRAATRSAHAFTAGSTRQIRPWSSDPQHTSNRYPLPSRIRDALFGLRDDVRSPGSEKETAPRGNQSVAPKAFWRAFELQSAGKRGDRTDSSLARPKQFSEQACLFGLVRFVGAPLGASPSTYSYAFQYD
jgi:hypothetical protein